MSRFAFASAVVISGVIAAGACVFDLADPVASGAGGSGATSSSTTNTGGSGGSGGEWWDDEWGFRVELTVSAAGRFDDAQLAVVLDQSRIDYAEARPDGGDVRFIGADGATELPYEIERWDSGGRSTLWVRLANAASGDTFTLYYGNPAASDESDGADVWTNYASVFHLAADLDAGVVPDSVGLQNGTTTTMTSADHIDGPIGPGYAFNNNKNITVSGSDEYDVLNGEIASVEIVYRRRLASDAGTLAHKEGCCVGWWVGFPNPTLLRPSWRSDSCCDGGGSDPGYEYLLIEPTPNAWLGAWHHLVVTYDRAAGQAALWVDGVPLINRGIDTAPNTGSTPTALRIGANFQELEGFSGEMEEVRYANFGFDDARAAFHDAIVRDQVIAYGAITARP